MRHTMCPSGTSSRRDAVSKRAFASAGASPRAPKLVECLGDVLREEEGALESGNAEGTERETETPRRLAGGVDAGDAETAAAAFFASTCASIEKDSPRSRGGGRSASRYGRSLSSPTRGSLSGGAGALGERVSGKSSERRRLCQGAPARDGRERAGGAPAAPGFRPGSALGAAVATSRDAPDAKARYGGRRLGERWRMSETFESGGSFGGRGVRDGRPGTRSAPA